MYSVYSGILIYIGNTVPNALKQQNHPIQSLNLKEISLKSAKIIEYPKIFFLYISFHIHNDFVFKLSFNMYVSQSNVMDKWNLIIPFPFVFTFTAPCLHFISFQFSSSNRNKIKFQSTRMSFYDCHICSHFFYSVAVVVFLCAIFHVIRFKIDLRTCLIVNL